MKNKEKKVWTLFRGKCKDALKDPEWFAMLQVVLGGDNRKIVIEIREE